ncbi:unnamed protein product [Dracunculus medinensis]|uniref:Rho GTPase-activating protein 27 n=1 Tax=Dracunculus medinensis TaxID=318479 RepID=A0A0N4U9Z7_DRAME|nr:unnamed protein product [Dracunculus medinensis]
MIANTATITSSSDDYLIPLSDNEFGIMENNMDTQTVAQTDLSNEEHVYANVREMEEASRRFEQPPIPDANQVPIRDLGNGWLEFFTETGRSYFFNPESNRCHWKPPRFLKPPNEVASLINGEDLPKVTIPAIHRDSDSHEDDSMASGSATESPLTTAKSLNDMLESMDSGISRASVNIKNKIMEKRMSVQAIAREVAQRVEAFKSNEELAINEAANLLSKQSGPCSSDSSIPSNRQQAKRSQKSIRSGVRVKKREWSSCYLFLSSAHIIFYKDEKSAEKSGRHYEAPLGMCDLRGASIKWVDEKDKRRKHIFQLELIDGTVYFFSTLSSQDINEWFSALQQVISSLPRPDTYPTPVLERSTTGIVRSGSSISHSSAFGNMQTRRSIKRMAKGQSKEQVSNIIVMEKASKSVGVEEVRPTRDSIIEKLKRFFRSRPTIESLKEKGIYKPEPVFGSTLAAICQHEQTTVPRFIQMVTEVIESKGIETDGLYRVSGNLSAIQRIRCQVDQEKYSTLLAEDDVHVLTGSLKLFFRELSEPIFPSALAKDFIHANRLPNGENKIKAFDELLKKLPLVNRETLKVLFGHLMRVASHADKNRMEIHNLAIMFGPSLFSSGNESGGIDPKRSANKKKGVDKKLKDKPSQIQSNSHLAFNMIMQGQTVEYLLKEFRRFAVFQESAVTSVV